jgi:hypothetical protein
MLIRSECNIQNEHIHLLWVKCNAAIKWKAQDLNLNVFTYVTWWSFEIALHGFRNLTISGANRANVKNGVRREGNVIYSHTRIELCRECKDDFVRSLVGNYRRKLPPASVVSCSIRLAAFVKRNVPVSFTETNMNGIVPQHIGAIPNDMLS